MSRATTSLPTPLSPVIRTLASERAAHSASSSTACIALLTPIIAAPRARRHQFADKAEHNPTRAFLRPTKVCWARDLSSKAKILRSRFWIVGQTQRKVNKYFQATQSTSLYSDNSSTIAHRRGRLALVIRAILCAYAFETAFASGLPRRNDASVIRMRLVPPFAARRNRVRGYR